MKCQLIFDCGFPTSDVATGKVTALDLPVPLQPAACLPGMDGLSGSFVSKDLVRKVPKKMA